MNAALADRTDLRRVGAGFLLAYALATCGVWMALLTPAILTLAMRVAEVDPAGKEAALAMIVGAGALVAMLANPIAGRLSDRTTSRFGMRRPWLLGGSLLGLAGLMTIAEGDRQGILVGWCLAQLGFNTVLAALNALLADQVPSGQRAMVSGIVGVSTPLGALGGILLVQFCGGSVLRMFMLPGLVAALGMSALLVTLRDRRADPAAAPGLRPRDLARGFLFDPRRVPDFGWAFGSRFLFILGLATLFTYQVFFLLERLGMASARIPAAMMSSTFVNTVAVVVGSLASGWLSDRLGRRKVFVATAASIYAVGLILVGTARDFPAFLAGIAVAGLAQGVYLAIDMVVLVEVLPDQSRDAAKDMGIFNLANALPQTVAPAIAPFFLSLGHAGEAHDYTSLFLAAAAFAALGALAILPVRAVR
jgi:MFS family permease